MGAAVALPGAMKNWILKATVQGVLSRLPQPQRWNQLLQTHVSRGLRLTEEFLLNKWRISCRHLDHYLSASSGPRSGFSALELGTGWFPIVPVGLALNGAGQVWTLDVQDLLSRERVIAVLELYLRLMTEGTLQPRQPGQRERLEAVLAATEGLSARAILARLGVSSLVLEQASDTGLPTGSMEIISSTSTLEHIPREQLPGIFKEFRRLASPDAVMSHFIDMGDNYSLSDDSITVYNFLKYSEQTWSLFNNRLFHQNRLRRPDYRTLHEASGWTVVAEEGVTRPLEELRSIPLAPEFRGYSESELQVFLTWMTSRPRGAGGAGGSRASG